MGRPQSSRKKMEPRGQKGLIYSSSELEAIFHLDVSFVIHITFSIWAGLLRGGREDQYVQSLHTSTFLLALEVVTIASRCVGFPPNNLSSS